MPKFIPTGRVHYDPKEREPNEQERLVLDFLELGLSYTLAQLEVTKTTNKLGTASILQGQAILLRDIIDGIRAGYHDSEHPTRIINPSERATYLFGQMPPIRWIPPG